MKIYVVGTHKKPLGEVLLMGTHNICFWEEINKYIFLTPFLSGAMEKYMVWSYGIPIVRVITI